MIAKLHLGISLFLGGVATTIQFHYLIYRQGMYSIFVALSEASS